MKNVILFDLDGTLLDTLQDLQESVNAALEAYGAAPHTLEEVRSYVGDGLAKLVERALPEGTAHPHYPEILGETRRIYRENSRNHTAPYSGIVSMLQQLHAIGYRMGVVSNKPDADVKQLCKHFFGDTIAVAIGANQSRRNKPAPDNLFAAMEQLGATVVDTVYVGDSDVDLDTARNAGVPCISVLWGFRDLAQLDAHGAMYCVRTADELVSMLQSGWFDMPSFV